MATARVIRLPNVRSASSGASRVPYTNRVAKAVSRARAGRKARRRHRRREHGQPEDARGSAWSSGAWPKPSTMTR